MDVILRLFANWVDGSYVKQQKPFNINITYSKCSPFSWGGGACDGSGVVGVILGSRLATM